MRKIALEEHFLIEPLLEHFGETAQNVGPSVLALGVSALMDLGENRLEILAKHDVFAVLSIAGPGVQVEKDPDLAEVLARRANDFLAERMQRHPQSYGGLAHLAMQEPERAANELERCIRDLGMQGAMINGQTNGEYLDLDRYEPFWERAAALEAPIYIHPGNPKEMPYSYEGHQELWGPVWSWGVETATHALRLVTAGVFERHPKARVILGHMGETLPFWLWRFDSRYPICRNEGHELPHPPSFYIKRNIAITTSGVCDDASLLCSVATMGEDSVMFSADYPFESLETHVQWIEAVPLSPSVKEKVMSGNAKSILRFKA